MPYPSIMADLTDGSFVEVAEGRYVLTRRGVRELLRLASHAGLKLDDFTPCGASDLHKSGPLV